MAQTVAWAIQKAFLHAQRKSDAPATGTSKYEVLLDLADTMQKQWETEPGIEWDSRYSLETIGTVTATDTFDLPDEVRTLSKSEDNPIRLTNGTSTTSYRLVKPSQLYKYQDAQVCAQVGRSLVFPKAFASDSSLLGFSIKVPALLYVSDITAPTDTIEVDDPLWLAYMMAAEFVRNDVVKSGQYDNLLALADQCMQTMKANNSGQLEEISAGAPWIAGESY